MKTIRCLALICLAIAPVGVWAQDSEIERLKKELQQMKETFERVQREQREQIESLTQRLNDLTKAQTAEAEKKKLEQELAAELSTNAPPGAGTPSATATGPATVAGAGPSLQRPGWSPSQPITVARSGSAYMNIAFDALMDVGWSTMPNPSQYLELGDHDPSQRGFSMPNTELAIDGAVDPYFKGFANIVLKLDQNNETSIELEETYLQSMSLPANLQLKGGQFLAAFGRQNLQHPHQWAFVDDPIILTRTLGPEGLRNPGVQLSWIAPLPFYTEVSLGVLDGEGSTAFSFRNPGTSVNGVNEVHGRATIDRTIDSFGNLLYVPRIATSFDLTDQQTLVTGVSAGLGPNDTGPNAYTQIYGGDVYWKWKSAKAHAGFPFLSLQAEGLYQIFDAGAYPTGGLPAETLRDWGFYSQASWGFYERWVAGLRGEYANGNPGAYDPYDPYRGERVRISPVLTFYPSEFSKLRLQYNYDQGELFGTQHSIWFQMEFLLGAHGAHKF